MIQLLCSKTLQTYRFRKAELTTKRLHNELKYQRLLGIRTLSSGRRHRLRACGHNLHLCSMRRRPLSQHLQCSRQHVLMQHPRHMQLYRRTQPPEPTQLPRHLRLLRRTQLPQPTLPSGRSCALRSDHVDRASVQVVLLSCSGPSART